MGNDDEEEDYMEYFNERRGMGQILSQILMNDYSEENIPKKEVDMKLN